MPGAYKTGYVPCGERKFRNISGRVFVRIHAGETTARTGKPMLLTSATLTTDRASLRGVRRVDIYRANPCGVRLVFDKGLQLSPRPPMQPASDTFSGADAVADMCQVFQCNQAGICTNRFLDKLLAQFVIYVAYMAFFSP